MSVVSVFGGAGFLGSHVTDELIKLGHDVRVFDCVDAPDYMQSLDWQKGDILDQDAVQNFIEGSEVVYNFAALSDLNSALDKPLRTIELNILGNGYILEACRKFSVSRFIYASTVYTKSRQGGFYRCSKAAAEDYIHEYHDAFDLNYTILRYGSLYGPRSDSSNGLYRIIRRSLEDGVVRYDGSENALREYIHVWDAARASVAAIEKEYENQTLVLTGQEQLRVKDLLEMIAEILGLSTGVEFAEKKQVGHYVRTPYAFDRGIGRKFVSPLHIDLGQGLTHLMEIISSEIEGDD